MQRELVEGSCRDRSWHREILISDLLGDGRWPVWAAKVSALGVSSFLAAELTAVEHRRIDAITVYWAHARTTTADDAAFVDLFAWHAAMALSQSLNEAGLNVAVDTCKVTDRRSAS